VSQSIENAKLPAWPLQSACWKNSSLHQDFGVSFRGNRSDVRYQIDFDTTTSDGTTFISIDWDTATATEDALDRLAAMDSVTQLLASVRDAVSVWFNVTLDVSCYNLTVAPNDKSSSTGSDSKVWSQNGVTVEPTTTLRCRPLTNAAMTRDLILHSDDNINNKDSSSNSTAICQKKMMEGSWPALCCNEEMYLIITEASGMGRDCMWPPSHPRGTTTIGDIISDRPANATDPYCHDPEGFFGYPKDAPDPWSTRYDEYYGGTRIGASSNIVFSNGLLDPWSAAGVYNAAAMDPTASESKGIPGLYLQNITSSGSMVAVIMEYGGHHTDLMYSSPNDPPSISAARDVEEQFVRKWIHDYYQS